MPDDPTDIAAALRMEAMRRASNADMYRLAARFLQDYIPLSAEEMANLRLPPGPSPLITSAPIRVEYPAAAEQTGQVDEIQARQIQGLSYVNLDAIDRAELGPIDPMFYSGESPPEDRLPLPVRSRVVSLLVEEE